MIRIGIACLALLAALAPAQARGMQPPLCKNYFDVATAPAEVANALRDYQARQRPADAGDVGLQNCVDGAYVTYKIWLPPRYDAGVCHYSQIDISSSFVADRGYLGGGLPIVGIVGTSDQRMMVAEAPCPKQDDDRYVGAHSLTPGVFRELMTLWARCSASEAALSALLAVPPGNTYARDDLENIKQQIRNRNSDFLKVDRVGFAGSTNEPDATFDIWIDSNPGGEIAISFELTAQGWRIVKVASWKS